MTTLPALLARITEARGPDRHFVADQKQTEIFSRLLLLAGGRYQLVHAAIAGAVDSAGKAPLSAVLAILRAKISESESPKLSEGER